MIRNSFCPFFAITLCETQLSAEDRSLSQKWSKIPVCLLFQTVTNCLIGGLAAADALVGLVGVPCVIVTLYSLPSDFYGCLLMNCMIIILTQVGISQ